MDDAGFDGNLHFRESTLGDPATEALLAIKEEIERYWRDPAPLDDGGIDGDECVDRIVEIMREKAGIVCKPWTPEEERENAARAAQTFDKWDRERKEREAKEKPPSDPWGREKPFSIGFGRTPEEIAETVSAMERNRAHKSDLILKLEKLGLNLQDFERV